MVVYFIVLGLLYYAAFCYLKYQSCDDMVYWNKVEEDLKAWRLAEQNKPKKEYRCDNYREDSFSGWTGSDFIANAVRLEQEGDRTA